MMLPHEAGTDQFIVDESLRVAGAIEDDLKQFLRPEITILVEMNANEPGVLRSITLQDGDALFRIRGEAWTWDAND